MYTHISYTHTHTHKHVHTYHIYRHIYTGTFTEFLVRTSGIQLLWHWEDPDCVDGLTSRPPPLSCGSPRAQCSAPLLFSLYTKPLSSSIHSPCCSSIICWRLTTVPLLSPCTYNPVWATARRGWWQTAVLERKTSIIARQSVLAHQGGRDRHRLHLVGQKSLSHCHCWHLRRQTSYSCVSVWLLW